LLTDAVFDPAKFSRNPFKLGPTFVDEARTVTPYSTSSKPLDLPEAKMRAVLPSRCNHECPQHSRRLTLLLVVLLHLTVLLSNCIIVRAQTGAPADQNIFQRLFDLLFKCGVIPLEGCGFLGLAAVIRATEDPKDPGCIEKCSFFPGVVEPTYFCGSCGSSVPVSAPVSSPVSAPVAHSARCHRWRL
jgi:hypothetical protein